MKIKKEIDSQLTETEITVKTWSETEYQKVFEKFDDRLKLNTTEGLCFINRSDLIYVEALRNYLELHATDTMFKIRSPLYKMKEVLGSDFIQVSRSYIINFQMLTSVEADIINGMIARVNGFKVPISRNYLKNIDKRIEEEK